MGMGFIRHQDLVRFGKNFRDGKVVFADLEKCAVLIYFNSGLKMNLGIRCYHAS